MLNSELKRVMQAAVGERVTGEAYDVEERHVGN